jgi:hypothetical protein
MKFPFDEQLSVQHARVNTSCKEDHQPPGGEMLSKSEFCQPGIVGKDELAPQHSQFQPVRSQLVTTVESETASGLAVTFG